MKESRDAWKQARTLSGDPLEQIALLPETDGYARGKQRIDSVLAMPPSIRWLNDSLAYYDSTTYALFRLERISTLYYYADTVAAAYAHFEALPWLQVFSAKVQTEEARHFAEALGEAVGITHSPNMARLSYQAFERAKRLAADYGDPHYIHLADSSYKAVARRVLTMPDSVRAAFGPPPDRPARIPWVLATIAAAFIAASVAAKSLEA